MNIIVFIIFICLCALNRQKIIRFMCCSTHCDRQEALWLQRQTCCLWALWVCASCPAQWFLLVDNSGALSGSPTPPGYTHMNAHWACTRFVCRHEFKLLLSLRKQSPPWLPVRFYAHARARTLSGRRALLRTSSERDFTHTCTERRVYDALYNYMSEFRVRCTRV